MAALVCQAQDSVQSQTMDPRVAIIRRYIDDGYNAVTGELISPQCIAYFVNGELSEKKLSKQALEEKARDGNIIAKLMIGKIVRLKRFAGPLDKIGNSVSIAWYEFLNINESDGAIDWYSSFSRDASEGKPRLWLFKIVLDGHPIHEVAEHDIILAGKLVK
ncbi:MAG: hypothetical protein NTV80_07645 [Verrucomicrobia bacterium]|nr:hypothetical protein [Verrucomicrobiota bacterium]